MRILLSAAALLTLAACTDGDDETGGKDSPGTTETGESGTDTSETGGETGDTGVEGWQDCQLAMDISQVPGGPDDTLAYAPSVVFDEDLGKWRMWYAVQDAMMHTAIAHSVSTDGLTWETPELSLIPGTAGPEDEGRTASPDVLRVGDEWWIYYDAWDMDVHSRIMRCVSDDGMTWGNCTLATDSGRLSGYDDGAAEMAFVLPDDTGYRMYYVGTKDDIRYILASESPDGSTFGDPKLLFEPGVAGEEVDGVADYAPFVQQDADGWRMLFTGRAFQEFDTGIYEAKRLVRATSDDGINWTDFTVSMDLGCQGTYDKYRADEAWVVETDEGVRLYYDGFDDPVFDVGKRRVLTAHATDW